MNFRVRAIGADFEANGEGSEYISADVARRAAVKSAVAIALDEIDKGKNSSIIEINIREGAGSVERYVVALSVERLPPSSD